jgi:gamma-tubulin complex component 3
MEIINLAQIPDLIEDLVKIFIPNPKQPNISSYYLRILSINLTKKFTHTEESAFQRIQNSMSLNDSIRTSQLYARLLGLSTLKHRPEILYLLSELKPDLSVAIPTKLLEVFEGTNETPTDSNSLFDYTRDALFAIQGINSRNFTYSEQYESFFINSAVSTPIYKISMKLTELGWLHKKITVFITQNINSMSSVTMQSLAYCIKKELNQYYKFVAMLDQMYDKCNTGVKRVLESCVDSIETLQWLGILCEAVEGLRGGEILSVIYCYWRTGKGSIKSLMRCILEEVSVPILQMIKSWMLEGELFDTFHEFFIFPNYTVNKNKIWYQMFKINPEMVPCFFSNKLVNKILLTGKSLYFLRRECLEEEWSECIPKVESILDIEKATWVTIISQNTNEKLISILFQKYRLQEHCLSIKKYLLMAQGDFHHALIEGMHSVLNLPVNKIYKHVLVSILETALKSSNCQYHDIEFTNRLEIVLDDLKGKETGWDIFSLDYCISSPLDTFFTSETMAKYRKVFNFLWKVKRAHFLMNSFQSPKDLIKIQAMHSTSSALKKTFLLGSQILHFINILSNYLMVESIESLWEDFYSGISKSKDLDELINTHNTFVEGILTNCFINIDNVYKQVLKILDIIIRYHSSKEIFISSVKEEHKRTSMACADDICRVSKQSLADIEYISSVFTDEVIRFMEILTENNDLKLKNLVFILDFNEYYSYEIIRKKGYHENEPRFGVYSEIIQRLSSFSRKYN